MPTPTAVVPGASLTFPAPGDIPADAGSLITIQITGSDASGIPQGLQEAGGAVVAANVDTGGGSLSADGLSATYALPDGLAAPQHLLVTPSWVQGGQVVQGPPLLLSLGYPTTTVTVTTPGQPTGGAGTILFGSPGPPSVGLSPFGPAGDPLNEDAATTTAAVITDALEYTFGLIAAGPLEALGQGAASPLLGAGVLSFSASSAVYAAPPGQVLPSFPVPPPVPVPNGFLSGPSLGTDPLGLSDPLRESLRQATPLDNGLNTSPVGVPGGPSVGTDPLGISDPFSNNLGLAAPVTIGRFWLAVTAADPFTGAPAEPGPVQAAFAFNGAGVSAFALLPWAQQGGADYYDPAAGRKLAYCDVSSALEAGAVEVWVRAEGGGQAARLRGELLLE